MTVMFIGCVIVTVVLSAMLALSASLKLRRDEKAVRVINETVGFPMRFFPHLAAAELAGAAGVIAGLWIAPLGMAAAVGVILYFVLAIGAHVRVGDMKGVGSPLIPLVVAAAALFLRVATA